MLQKQGFFSTLFLYRTQVNLELAKQNIQLHLSEVKGPVMDRLQSSKLLKHLSGNVFLTHYQAIQTLSPQLLKTS